MCLHYVVDQRREFLKTNGFGVLKVTELSCHCYLSFPERKYFLPFLFPAAFKCAKT